MRPPVNNDRSSDSRSLKRNGVDVSHPDQKKSTDQEAVDENWNRQKSRIDGLLSKLKKEMQEVKVMDKDLTRQFIHLGGKIQELKAAEKQFFEQLSMQGQSFFDDEDSTFSDVEDGTSVTIIEDTRL